jgi:uncharacterized protein (TIGR00369 family)
MTEFEPRDPEFDNRVRESFDRQEVMRMIGAKIVELDAGRVRLEMPYSEKLTQQHGFLHGGMLATALDSACGYAALSLMPADTAVLTIEYKVNLLAPADGSIFDFVGTVIKPGRTIMVSEGRAYAIRDDRAKLVATMSSTVMVVTGREDLRN